MANVVRKWMKYWKTKSEVAFSERADPKIQLEQAIAEAQDQHRRLIDQAANVIANQKQTSMRLHHALEDLEKVNGSARQAVRMADEAAKAGDAQKAAEYAEVARAFANRLIAAEREVEGLKQLQLQTTQGADEAKAAVARNASALQAKLSERQKLLTQLDQAKMQEQVNQAMTSLSETVGQDVPTLDEVRTKIEARYAKALGHSELAELSVGSKMLEVEAAQMNSEADARLAEIRTQLGLEAGPAPAAIGRAVDTPAPEQEGVEDGSA